LAKVRESEDLQKLLREAIKAKLAAGEIDLAADADDGEDDDDASSQLGPFEKGTEFEPVEAPV
jgi:hypothetical protein